MKTTRVKLSTGAALKIQSAQDPQGVYQDLTKALNVFKKPNGKETRGSLLIRGENFRYEITETDTEYTIRLTV